MERKIKSLILPIYLQKLLIKIHHLINEDRFLLYGGAPIDLLLNKRNDVRDFDVAVESTDERKISEVKERLVKKGFDIIEPYREYMVRKNKKVVLV